ncbi:tetratricopeptide repeat protein [uncultured Shimia sp.]|uniref:tetratricopeptide repeat protein n=1 Tax=uncultured Shimia sp. TaxID=573152 RepID=UPI00263A3BBA|nr:tetratricopeptide repeat protein [uncultured Shimia sp.]
MPSDAYSLDEETCLTLASAPFQLEDFLGVLGRDVMVEPALEACEKAYKATDTLNPEVRAVYARALLLSGDYGASADQARIAAEEGSALAMNTLAIAYERGRGTEKNSGESLKWYAEAAKAGFPMAQYNLAQRVKSDDPELALKLYRAAADAGYGSAQIALGKLYREGTLVSKDLDTAMSWFEMAIEDNQDIDAMYWAALILSGDSGAYPLDYERALSLYERSADAGDKWSQHNVAAMYFHGKGTAPDRDRAQYYFGLAAEQDHVKSMRKYGRLKHENGDPAAALYWYQRAADEGDEVAAELLAKLLGE